METCPYYDAVSVFDVHFSSKTAILVSYIFPNFKSKSFKKDE